MSSDDGGRRQQGILADWNDDRGFGFITPDGGGSRVFVHISAFPRGRRPAAGCELTFVQARDERHRARASDVRYLGAAPARASAGSGVGLVSVVAAVFFALLALLAVGQEVPILLVGAYVVVSVITFFAYGADKAAAEEGRWRTSESTLHLLALAGGWPGALVAQRVFRHKTTKQPFRTVFWITVVVNCAALTWVVTEAPLTSP